MSYKDKPSRNLKTSILVWSVTGLLVGLISLSVAIGVTKTPPEPRPLAAEPANVEVITVEARPYEETIVLPAKIVADEVVTVSCETEDVLSRWLVEEGACVEKGDLLALVEKDTLLVRKRQLESSVKAQQAGVGVSEAEVEMERMALETARMQRDTRKKDLEGALSSLRLANAEHRRKANLLRRGALSQSAYDAAEDAATQARVTVDKARTALAQAEVAIRATEARLKLAKEKLALAEAQRGLSKAQLQELEIQLQKAEVRAPVSGMVDEHLLKAGERASVGTPLARIYKNDVMRAVVNVPDRQAPFLDAGNRTLRQYVLRQTPGARPEVRAEVTIPGPPRLTGGFERGVDLKAEIVRIAAATDENSNTFQVELKIDNPGRAIRHGLLGEARISYLTYPQAVVIPVRAVQMSELGPRVFVASKRDGRDVAEVRDIEPGGIRDGELFVTGGVQAGEKLVVSGQRGLVHGESIRIVQEDGELKVR